MSGTLAIAAPAPKVQQVFQKMISATISDNYEAFVADCNATMKAAISKEMLSSVSQQLAPRARQGYDTEYFGEMKQQGYDVYLWRLRFKDGGDDLLATMSLKDGKVGGFYVH